MQTTNIKTRRAVVAGVLAVGIGAGSFLGTSGMAFADPRPPSPASQEQGEGKGVNQDSLGDEAQITELRKIIDAPDVRFAVLPVQPLSYWDVNPDEKGKTVESTFDMDGKYMENYGSVYDTYMEQFNEWNFTTMAKSEDTASLVKNLEEKGLVEVKSLGNKGLGNPFGKVEVKSLIADKWKEAGDDVEARTKVYSDVAGSLKSDGPVAKFLNKMKLGKTPPKVVVDDDLNITVEKSQAKPEKEGWAGKKLGEAFDKIFEEQNKPVEAVAEASAAAAKDLAEKKEKAQKELDKIDVQTEEATIEEDGEG